MYNKLMLYKQILKPVWAYGIQLWGCTKQSNTDIIHRFQNKVLRNIFDAPWYIRNADPHRDLQMEMVTNEIDKFAKKREERLLHHFNVEAIHLLDNSELVKESRNRPGVAQRVPGGIGSQISCHSARVGGEVVSLTHRPPLPPGMFLVLIFTRG
jgi:hypothetical protein